jgi:hypothetical protein
MKTRVIGIDPGVTTGLAVWDKAGKRLVEVTSMLVHEAMDRVREEHAAGLLCEVVFEDARQRTWFGGVDAKVSRYGSAVREGAGAAKRDARIWADFLESLGVRAIAQKPIPGTTKWSDAYFKRMTGWPGRTNEHARDAALLVIGRS